jgi:hypothetical protein
MSHEVVPDATLRPVEIVPVDIVRAGGMEAGWDDTGEWSKGFLGRANPSHSVRVTLVVAAQFVESVEFAQIPLGTEGCQSLGEWFHPVAMDCQPGSILTGANPGLPSLRAGIHCNMAHEEVADVGDKALLQSQSRTK